MSEPLPNAQQAVARIQAAKTMADLCDGVADLVGALAACAAWTKLALIGAHHDWLMCDVSRSELASFLALQQDHIAFLQAVHGMIRQKADLWSATRPDVDATIQ